MKDKIDKIGKINSDLDYLRGEYANIKLWGSSPDGDVEFSCLIKWLADNEHLVKHMLETSNQLNEL